MAEERVQRRLAAILAADVVGYNRMMREDETGDACAAQDTPEGNLRSQDRTVWRADLQKHRRPCATAVYGAGDSPAEPFELCRDVTILDPERSIKRLSTPSQNSVRFLDGCG